MRFKNRFLHIAVVAVIITAQPVTAYADSLPQVSATVMKVLQNVSSQKILEAKVQAESIIQKPDSVMRTSCYDQFMKLKTGSIFGNTGIMDKVEGYYDDFMSFIDDPWAAIGDALNSAIDSAYASFDQISLDSVMGTAVEEVMKGNHSKYESPGLPALNFSSLGSFSPCDAGSKVWDTAKFSPPALELNMTTERLMEALELDANPMLSDGGSGISPDILNSFKDGISNLTPEELTVVGDPAKVDEAMAVTDPGVCTKAIPNATEFLSDNKQHYAYTCSNPGCWFDNEGNKSKTLVGDDETYDPPSMNCVAYPDP